MQIEWRRSRDQLNYSKPSIWFALGCRGSGKSSFLESVGEEYLRADHNILDLFGSRDGEALAWLRSEWAKDKKILLVKGENVDVKSSFNSKVADAITVSDLEKNDIVISASPLYLSIDQEFIDAAKIEDILYRRMHWKKIIYLCCREASNFYYSRLKVCDSQTYAKAQMIYLIRESRHMGISMGLDSIRYYAIDIDIRSLSDNLILKAQGVMGLPKDLKWLYAYVDPGLMRHLGPQRFIVVTRRGAIGLGSFPEVPWHKKEKEDILKEVGLEVEYGEMLQDSVLKGTYRTVSDKEHVEIIRLYAQENMGTVAIGKKLNRSSRTPVLHIHSHNDSVTRAACCPICKRAKGEYADKIVHRDVDDIKTAQS